MSHPASRSRRTSLVTHGVLVAAAAATLGLPLIAAGASGTWINPSGGTWNDGDTANWYDGVVADGADFTADFSNLDLTASVNVSLGESRTIGHIVFGDTDTGTSGSLTVDNGGDASHVLTLAGGAPTITVGTLGSGSLARISAVIEGSDGLVKEGDGLLVLTGANTYSGGTIVQGGDLRISHNSAAGGGVVTVADGSRLQVQGVTLTNTLNISGNRALNRSGGSSDLAGVVNLDGNATVSLTGTGNGTITFSGTVNLGEHTLTVATVGSSFAEITGVVTGTGGITKINDSNLTIIGDNSAGYAGTTTLARGTLLLGHDAAMGTGTFAFQTNNDSTARIRSADSTDRTIANPMLIAAQSTNNVNARHQFGSAGTGNLDFTGPITIDGNRKLEIFNTTTFSGDMTGAGGFTMQTAAGTLILAGSNDYTGATNVNAGTLLVHGINSGTGTVTVNAGGTLGGTGQIAGDVVFADGSTFLALADGPLGIGGAVSLGDNVTLATADALTLASYTILTHSGDVDGTFAVDASISDLGYQVVYGSNACRS